MDQLLDLCITLTLPPPTALPDVLAAIDLRCEMLSFFHTGDLLTDPLTRRERRDLQWYLEEYWMWPYEGFARRGKEAEALLASVGKRLYQALFGSTQVAGIMQIWNTQQDRQRQISIISDVPAVLSLPWELLHDDQGFLALRVNQPVSIVRRLPLSEQSSHQVMFVPPLRILLVTSQPEGTGFVDPRGVARELYNARHYALQALAIAEASGVATEVWRPLDILADIAEMEGILSCLEEISPFQFCLTRYAPYITNAAQCCALLQFSSRLPLPEYCSLSFSAFPSPPTLAFPRSSSR